jgi:hypothetical protein
MVHQRAQVAVDRTMAQRATRMSTLAAVAASVVLLAACTGDGVSPSSDRAPAASSESDGAAATDHCPSVEIRGPDGSVPDLSGTWVGVAERGALPTPGRYEFNLLNSCVAWVGRSTEEGEEVGASWMNVLIGKVNSDLTISGEWAVVTTGANYCRGGTSGAFCDRARGTLVLRIDWIDTAEGNKLRLVLEQVTKLGEPSAVVGQGYFMTGIWVRPGDEDLFDLPVD